MGDPQINFVIPLYNEEEVFEALINRLDDVIESTELSVEVILIDDGSSDRTSELIKDLCEKNHHYKGLLLARNFGHQVALTAGLAHVNATEAVFILDGDLQDPPELLDKFYQKMSEGYDVVYAVREKRKEGLIKRLAYKYFYRIMSRIAYSEIPLDSGDFSLVSRRVIDILNSMPEESRFIRGMRSWIGFKQIGVTYERSERHSGESKYSLKRLLQLAFNGIFNFSEYPIKVLMRLGILVISISVIYLIYTLIMRFVFDEVGSGFTALLTVIILFGGIQLVALGLIGEYILRIFFQVKGRPLFIVREFIEKKE